MNTIGAAIIVGAGIAFFWMGEAVGVVERSGWILVAIGILAILVGLLFVARSALLRVTLTPDEATIRGYLHNVRIPRNGVEEVTDYPSIVWVDARGKRHTSPVNAINIFRSTRADPDPRIVAHKDAKVLQLRTWANS